ncbi:PGF-CTERM sorting domain-containing protein [Halosegnis sp.]|uniref:PGF-CTERM sorting domain-containing protein n=1 Tax=Halosegnis sp. TaxID=2864959 RepID=UPI0035D44A2D
MTYSGLAAVDGDRLVVTEPFASGFEPDRLFVVRGPEGYAVSEAASQPTATDDWSGRYEAETGLDGFAVSLAPTETESTGTTTDGGGEPTETGGQPGFGVVAALVALAAVLVARR